MVSRYASLPSPKLPLFPKQQSFAAFVAYTSESSPARPAALPVSTAPLLHGFIAFSAAEPVEIYREKALFDCLGTFNLSISVACAVLPAMGTELVRSNILPASFIVPEDEEPLPPVETEPFDWLLVLQTSSLTLARDLLGKIVQQCVEIFSKARVPKWVHDELIKHVSTFAERMRGPPPRTWREALSARYTASRAVLMSTIPYVSKTFGMFVADVVVDAARLCFPMSWRSRLVFHSDDPSVACFTTNFKLKVGKHALAGSLSYAFGVVTAFLLPGGTFFIGLFVCDLGGILIADSVVAQFGDIK